MRRALSQALRRVHIGPKKLKLDEETRWQITGEIEGLRQHGALAVLAHCHHPVCGRMCAVETMAID